MLSEKSQTVKNTNETLASSLSIKDDDSLSLNRYLYAVDNLMMFVDPSGYRPVYTFNDFNILDCTLKRCLSNEQEIRLLKHQVRREKENATEGNEFWESDWGTGV